MTNTPKNVGQTQSDEAPGNVRDGVDRYHGVSDTELHEARGRRLRKMNDLGPSEMRDVHEVEQIQDELVRRARARHPSNQ
jgi:hypothetical protein